MFQVQLLKSEFSVVKHFIGKGEGGNIRRWEFTRLYLSIPDQNLVQEADQLDVLLLLACCLCGKGLLLKACNIPALGTNEG